MPKWWDKKYGKNNICAITRTRLRPGKNKLGYPYSFFLYCGHGFVRTALINMIKRQEYRCPLCRKNFNPNFLYYSQ